MATSAEVVGVVPDRKRPANTCVSPAQFQAMVAAAGQSPTVSPSSANSAASTTASTTPDTPPVIQINGDNPAHVSIGSTYQDLGATITAPQADKTLGIKTFLNGALVSDIVLNTSVAATDTIDYVVTDPTGLTTTSTRIVVADAASVPLVPDYSATTTLPTSPTATTSPTVAAATSTAQ